MAPKLRGRAKKAVVIEEVEEEGDTVMSDSPRQPKGNAKEQEATSANSDPQSLALQTSTTHPQSIG